MNVLVKRSHCLLSDPATHITSSINSVIVIAFVEGFQTSLSQLFRNVFKAKRLNDMDQRFY